jgi:hypothetical protein
VSAFPDWTIRGDGQEFEIPGAKVGSNGVWLPNDVVPEVAQLLAEGVANRGSARQLRESLQAENRQLRQQLQNHPDLIRAQAFNKAILAKLNEGPEAVQQWLEDFDNSRPRLIAEAEAEVLRQQHAATQRELAELREERESATLQPLMEQSLQEAVADFANRPEFAGVDAEMIYERVRSPQGLDAVFYEVSPQDRAQGLLDGESLLGRAPDGTLYVMNWGVIADEFAYQAQIRGPAPAAAPSAAAAAAANAQALAQPAAQGSAQTVAPTGTPPVPQFPKTPEGKKQMDKWYEEQFAPQR